MVTLALAGPRDGAPVVDSFTAGSSNGGGSDAILTISARTASAVFPSASSWVAKAARRRLTAQFGSFARHSAIFMLHPHPHASVRIIASAALRLASGSGVRSTPGRVVAVCQDSCAKQKA